MGEPRVALDARWMQGPHRGGVGRSLASLVPLLAEHVDLHLLTTTDLPRLDLGLPEHALPTPRTASSWLQLSAPRFLRRFEGVFHCPWYGLPLVQPVPMVATLHDLTFEHWPEWFGRGQRHAFRLQARTAARRAAALVVPSAHVRDDVVRTYGVSPQRLLVASQAADAVFAPDAPGGVRARLGLPATYLVALGGAARRGLHLAHGAWRSLGRPDVPLVVVGEERLPGAVTAGRLPDAELAGLLAGAAALLYPTAYEGFGMPALEALACGTPVVAARVGALPEVLGDAAVWAASREPAALAAALSGLLEDADAAQELRSAALRRAAAAPGWAEAAAVHLEAYRRAAA